MQQRLQKYRDPLSASTTVKGNDAQVQPAIPQWNENEELKQTNVLYALLENRFEKESPLPNHLRYPASNSEHYDNVIVESESAPSRGLVTKIANRLKGMIRLT